MEDDDIPCTQARDVTFHYSQIGGSQELFAYEPEIVPGYRTFCGSCFFPIDTERDYRTANDGVEKFVPCHLGCHMAFERKYDLTHESCDVCKIPIGPNEKAVEILNRNFHSYKFHRHPDPNETEEKNVCRFPWEKGGMKMRGTSDSISQMIMHGKRVDLNLDLLAKINLLQIERMQRHTNAETDFHSSLKKLREENQESLVAVEREYYRQRLEKNILSTS